MPYIVNDLVRDHRQKWFFHKKSKIICGDKNKVLPLQPLSKESPPCEAKMCVWGFCTTSSELSNGIKAITSDFGSENPGSIPGWTTNKKGARDKGSLFMKV